MAGATRSAWPAKTSADSQLISWRTPTTHDHDRAYRRALPTSTVAKSACSGNHRTRTSPAPSTGASSGTIRAARHGVEPLRRRAYGAAALRPQSTLTQRRGLVTFRRRDFDSGCSARPALLGARGRRRGDTVPSSGTSRDHARSRRHPQLWPRASSRRLDRLVDTGRGGDVTLHAPELVCYRSSTMSQIEGLRSYVKIYRGNARLPRYARGGRFEGTSAVVNASRRKERDQNAGRLVKLGAIGVAFRAGHDARLWLTFPDMRRFGDLRAVSRVRGRLMAELRRGRASVKLPRAVSGGSRSTPTRWSTVCAASRREITRADGVDPKPRTSHEGARSRRAIRSGRSRAAGGPRFNPVFRANHSQLRVKRLRSERSASSSRTKSRPPGASARTAAVSSASCSPIGR